ncbi:aldo/keto reductase [Roseateles sp.]|uniref:aldo/keto reductase n=1 Tax=Roseateles sp. TaxID=1971397 RepID=UPI003D12D0E3
MIIGTWQSGGSSWKTVSTDTAHAALRHAIETGHRDFDTAPSYGDGVAEAALGRLLREAGVSDARVFTKIPPDRLRRDQLLATARESVERLGRPVEALLVHWPAGTMGCEPVPTEEIAHAMLEAKAQGLTRRIGLSNHSLAEIQDFERFAPVEAAQYAYSPLYRVIEADVLPYLRGLGVTPQAYSPLAQGLLAPGPRAPIGEGDHRNWVRLFKGDLLAQCQAFRTTLIEAYGEQDFSAVVLAWVRAKGLSPIVGIHRPEHLDLPQRARTVTLSEEEVARIDAWGAPLLAQVDGQLSMWG